MGNGVDRENTEPLCIPDSCRIDMEELKHGIDIKVLQQCGYRYETVANRRDILIREPLEKLCGPDADSCQIPRRRYTLCGDLSDRFLRRIPSTIDDTDVPTINVGI